MSEKFRKVVNAPHFAAKRLKEKIKDKTPTKTVGKIARGAGITTAAMTQFLLWAAKYTTLDNHITRAGEKAFAKIKVGTNKEGKNKKIPSVIKHNPNLTAIVSWWMLLASVGLGGGKTVVDNVRDRIEQRVADDKQDEEDVENEQYEPGTFGAYYDKLQTITPFVIAGLIEYEGVRVNAEGLHVVYDDYTGKPLQPGQKPRGTATIGFGSTVLKDGTKVTSYTKPITTEEAYELARWHLEEGETYFGMYCYDTAFETVDINSVAEATSIADIMYNGFSNLIEPKTIDKKPNRILNDRFAILRQSYKDNGAGLTEEEVLDAFQKYPAINKYSFGEAWLNGKSKQEIANTLGNFMVGGPGQWGRRWIEAGLLTGDLAPEVLLDCPMDALNEFKKYKGGKKSVFWQVDAHRNPVVNKANYAEFVKWLENPVDAKGHSLANRKKVRDYMPEYALAACDGRVCQLGDKAPTKQRVRQKQVERETYVIDYETVYGLALDAYKSGDYEFAAQQLSQLVAAYPNNALLHNDLAATYNHLGLYEEAIKHAQEIVKRIGDKSQYAAAQYNAGFAYEQLGQLDKALANYKLSVSNGNRRVQSDVTRVKNQINKNTNTKPKTVSFNDASVRVKKMVKTNTVPTIKNDERRA